MKKQIIIWGTGTLSRRLCHYLNYEEIEIIGFTDNSAKNEREENFILGFPYIPVADALNEKYDFIVIGCAAYCDVTYQLLYEGISKEKIIQAYNVNYLVPETLYFYNEIVTDEEQYSVFKSLDCLAFMIF